MGIVGGFGCGVLLAWRGPDVVCLPCRLDPNRAPPLLRRCAPPATSPGRSHAVDRRRPPRAAGALSPSPLHAMCRRPLPTRHPPPPRDARQPGTPTRLACDALPAGQRATPTRRGSSRDDRPSAALRRSPPARRAPQCQPAAERCPSCAVRRALSAGQPGARHRPPSTAQCSPAARPCAPPADAAHRCVPPASPSPPPAGRSPPAPAKRPPSCPAWPATSRPRKLRPPGGRRRRDITEGSPGSPEQRCATAPTTRQGCPAKRPRMPEPPKPGGRVGLAARSGAKTSPQTCTTPGRLTRRQLEV